MLDWQRRDQFDEVWNKKLKNSKYDLQDAMTFEFTSAKCKEGMILHFITKDNVKVSGILRQKPSYIDSYMKVRHRGFLIMEEAPEQYFYAHINNVFSREK